MDTRTAGGQESPKPLVLSKGVLEPGGHDGGVEEGEEVVVAAAVVEVDEEEEEVLVVMARQWYKVVQNGR